MPTIQKIHVRYVNKKKLNDLLKSLFKADTYEFEVSHSQRPVLVELNFGCRRKMRLTRPSFWLLQESFQTYVWKSIIRLYLSHRQEDWKYPAMSQDELEKIKPDKSKAWNQKCQLETRGSGLSNQPNEILSDEGSFCIHAGQARWSAWWLGIGNPISPRQGFLQASV